MTDDSVIDRIDGFIDSLDEHVTHEDMANALASLRELVQAGCNHDWQNRVSGGSKCRTCNVWQDKRVFEKTRSQAKQNDANDLVSAKELDTSTEPVKSGTDSLHVAPTDDERRDILARGVAKEMGAPAVGRAHQKIADAVLAWMDDEQKPVMTDDSVIEEAAKAIARSMPGWNDDTTEPGIEDARMRAHMESKWESVNAECMKQGREHARAAFAVFEKAHAPTDDERVPGFAEREKRAARAWEFFARDDREMSHDFRGGYHQGMIDGFRRSEVHR